MNLHDVQTVFGRNAPMLETKKDYSGVYLTFFLLGIGALVLLDSHLKKKEQMKEEMTKKWK